MVLGLPLPPRSGRPRSAGDGVVGSPFAGACRGGARLPARRARARAARPATAARDGRARRRHGRAAVLEARDAAVLAAAHVDKLQRLAVAHLRAVAACICHVVAQFRRRLRGRGAARGTERQLGGARGVQRSAAARCTTAGPRLLHLHQQHVPSHVRPARGHVPRVVRGSVLRQGAPRADGPRPRRRGRAARAGRAWLRPQIRPPRLAQNRRHRRPRVAAALRGARRVSWGTDVRRRGGAVRRPAGGAPLLVVGRRPLDARLRHGPRAPRPARAQARRAAAQAAAHAVRHALFTGRGAPGLVRAHGGRVPRRRDGEPRLGGGGVRPFDVCADGEPARAAGLVVAAERSVQRRCGAGDDGPRPRSPARRAPRRRRGGSRVKLAEVPSEGAQAG